MAEKYRFFDAVEDENGQYDREYNAQEFTDYFKALVTTGIMKGAGNEGKVTTNGSSMITSIDTVIAFLLGRYYENDSLLELTHDTETLGKSRIDRIVIRMDLNTEARYVKAFIKKGVASTNPVPPALTQTPNLYEISLAQVKIVGGQTYIGVNDVTDERGKDVICPWAGSNILPNFNDEALGQLINDVSVLNSKIDLKANKKLENWIPLTLQNGWGNNFGDQIFFGIKKDEFGFVHISGILTKTGVSGTETIATLPTGYRPKAPMNFAIGSNGGLIQGAFNHTGEIILTIPSGMTSVFSATFNHMFDPNYPDN